MLASQKRRAEEEVKNAKMHFRGVSALYTLLREHLVKTGKMTREQLDTWEREAVDRRLAPLGFTMTRTKVVRPDPSGILDPSGQPVIQAPH